MRGRAAFAALRHEGRRVRKGTVTVTWVPGDPAEPPRVAYAIGRRAGGAVVRNRIRRRLRAIIREVGAELVPGAYLVGAGADAATLPYGELRTTVSEALRAVTARRGRGA
jgi:ribonuclease P protein component